MFLFGLSFIPVPFQIANTAQQGDIQIRVENTCHSARLALAVDLDKAEQDFIALPVFSLVASRRASGRDLVDGALSARHENTLGFHLKFF